MKRREKEMITIRNFVEKYDSIVVDKLKEQYLKDNLHIKTYIPFLTKVTLADKLAKITTLDKDTGNINVKSDVNYLLFCRMVIEQYTDLQVETEEFFEEYDALMETGVLDIIMQMIPEKEIKELKMICDMKKDDLLFNQSTPKAFINQQIERITNITSVTLKPVLDKLVTELENMDDSKIEKLSKVLEKGLKRIK